MLPGKNVPEQVILFNKIILNIFHEFISNKIIICDKITICDGKGPFWMNDETKTLIKKKHWLYWRQRKSENLDYATLKDITTDTSNAVNYTKLKYNERLAKNFNNPRTETKTY